MEGVSRTRLEAHLSGDGAAPGDGCAKYAGSCKNERAGLRVLQLWPARPEHQHRACFLLSLSCRFSRGDLLPEEFQRQPQPFIQMDLRLPSEQARGLADIGATLLGIVLRKRLENDGHVGSEEGANAFGEFQNRDFLRIADIYGFVLLGIHQPVDAFDEVRHITEAACLPPVPIDGDGLAPKRLVYEIGQGAPVMETHARSISIKDADDTRIHAVEAVISHDHGFRKSLGFIVDAARTDRVYVPPIAFRLWTDLRIAIAFGSGGQQVLGFFRQRQPERVVGAERAYLRRLNRQL